MTEEALHDLMKKIVALPVETEWVEFKHNGSVPNKEIGDYISSLSNGACLKNEPYGYLVWGVKDGSHQVIGTTFQFSRAKEGNQDLELWLRVQLSPKINFEIFEFKFDGKPITMVQIPAAHGEPINFKGSPFIRINSNKTNLRNYPDLMRKIYNSQDDWSARIIEKASINDLDHAALKIARQKFIEKSSNNAYVKEIKDWDEKTFLDKAKVTINGKITAAAIILLGKEESSHYLLPSIAQITWKLDSEEKAYEHLGPPFLLNTTKVLSLIRNVKYKIFPDNALLATTVDKYETRVILEALHNCIAHQDYALRSKIIVTEKIDRLIFLNAGRFFVGLPEDYIEENRTPERYRNPWLAQAMVSLGMIDTVGYGIHTMYQDQRKRFFPMPDYVLSEPEKVALQIYGHVIDENYTKLLMERNDLSFHDVILLDRIQKKIPIPAQAYSRLKKRKLIEGRKPNYYIAASVATTSDAKATYIKNKAFDNEYYEKLIIEYLSKYETATRQDINKLLLGKLSDSLSEKQKANKVRNVLSKLHTKDYLIYNVSGSSKQKYLWALTPKGLDKIRQD